MPTPRYSSRLPWNSSTNRLSLRIAERHAAGQSLVDLTDVLFNINEFVYIR